MTSRANRAVPRLAAALLARLTASDAARRSSRYFDDQSARILLIILLDLVGAASFAVTPFVLRHLVDHGLAVPGGSAALIAPIAALLFVFVFQAAATAASQVLSAGLGEAVTQRTAIAVHDHLLRLPYGFFPGQRQGDLLTLFGTDIDEVRTAVARSMPRAVSTGTAAVVGAVTIALLDWRLAVVAAALTPVIFGLLALGRRRGRELTREHIRLRTRKFAQIADSTGVAGALHIRLFGRTEYESERFAAVVTDIRRIGLERNWVAARAGLMSSAGAAVAVVIVIGFGAWLVSTGRSTIGTLIAFASALLYAYRPVTSLAESRSDLLEAGVAFERIFGLFDVPVDPRDPPTVTAGRPAALAVPAPRAEAPKPEPEPAPEVRIDDVWFRYPPGRANAWSAAGRALNRRWWNVQEDEDDEAADGTAPAPDADWTLRGVSLRAGSARKTAIVGASGAGKSTLGALLAGLHQPSRGRIDCGGEDLAVMEWSRLRSLVGVVPQDPYLFHDTIGANIRYGLLTATDDELEEAAVDAGLRPLLDKLPKRLDTVVGARGYQLSGGERQRLALARVLLADPPVLILDEATSQLDSVTEMIVQDALERLGVGRTRIVIAHRLSTVVDADILHVMADGRVVEQGTHPALMARDGTYARLYARQLDGVG